MDEAAVPEGLGGIEARRKSRSPLVRRAMRERWALSREMRSQLIRRLAMIAADPSAEQSEIFTAARLVLSASKLNQANIATTIIADDHTDLHRRVTAIEQEIEARESERQA